MGKESRRKKSALSPSAPAVRPSGGQRETTSRPKGRALSVSPASLGSAAAASVQLPWTRPGARRAEAAAVGSDRRCRAPGRSFLTPAGGALAVCFWTRTGQAAPCGAARCLKIRLAARRSSGRPGVMPRRSAGSGRPRQCP